MAATVLDDTGRSGDALGTAKVVGDRGVVDGETGRDDVGFANHDGACRGLIIEDHRIGGLEIRGAATGDDAHVLLAAAGGMPGGIGDAGDIAMPADRVARDGKGDLRAGIRKETAADLAAVEAGDGTRSERERAVTGKTRVSDEVVGAVGQGTGLGGIDRDGSRAAVGGDGAGVEDRGGASVDVGQAKGSRATEDEIGNGERTAGAIARLQGGPGSKRGRPLERTRAGKRRAGGHSGGDAKSGIAGQDEFAAVHIEGDGAGEGAGGTERESAGAGLRHRGRAERGAVDVAAEGNVGADGKRTRGAEAHGTAGRAAAFEGEERLGGVVKIEGRTGHVGQGEDRVRREGASGAGTERPCVDRSGDRVGVRGAQAPRPCPALHERGRAGDRIGDGAVAGARERQRASDGIEAGGGQVTGNGERVGVGTQRERTAAPRRDCARPSIRAADVLKKRRDQRNRGDGDATLELDHGPSFGGDAGGGTQSCGLADVKRAARNGDHTSEREGTLKRERACAILGETGRAKRNRTGERDVAGAAEGQGEARRRQGTGQRQRTRVTVDARGGGNRQRCAESVRSGNITKGTGRGAGSIAAKGQRLGDHDAALDLQSRAWEDRGADGGRAKSGRAADVDGAGIDARDTSVIARAGKRKHAGPFLDEGKGAIAAVVNCTGEDRIRGGKHGEHRGADLQSVVGDGAARTGQGTDSEATLTVDVHLATRVDGERTIETGVATQGIGRTELERACADGRSADEAVGTAEGLRTGAGLQDREVAGDRTGIGVVTRVASAIGTQHVQSEDGSTGRGIRDRGGQGRNAGQATDGLIVAGEVEGRGADRRKVKDGIIRQTIGRTEGDVGGLIEEVVRGTAAGEDELADARRDDLTRGRGHGARDIKGGTSRGEDRTHDGLVDRDATGKRRGTRRAVGEDGPIARLARSIVEDDVVGERDAARDLQLAAAIEIDLAAAQGARSGDLQDTGTAEIGRSGVVIGGVRDDEHARSHFSKAEASRDLGIDREEGGSRRVPLMHDEVAAVVGLNRATGDGEGVGAAGAGDQDTAAADNEASRGVQGIAGSRSGVETKRIDGPQRTANVGGGRAVDIDGSAGGEVRAVSRVFLDAIVGAIEYARREGGTAADGGPTAEESARGFVGIGRGRVTEAAVDDAEVDRPALLTGDGAEIQGQTSAAGDWRDALGRDGTTRSKGGTGERLH